MQQKNSARAVMRENEWTIKGFLDLIRQVHEGKYQKKFCFILGAGASRKSGIPSGQELVDRWEKEMQERNAAEHEAWKNGLGITDDNKYQHYSDYYEAYFLEQEDGYQYLKQEMADAMPSAGYVVLAYLLCQTPHKVVITTNFDHLVEKAVNEYTHTIPLVIGHEAIAHHVPSQITDPVVLKIHNDLLLKPKSVKRDLKILPKAWVLPLKRIFSEYYPIFIGYAGNDPSLMDFLLKNVGRFQSGEWKKPYWTLYGEEQPTEKAEKFVNGAGGIWVRHEGFDIVLCQIGKEMGYAVPKDEDEEAFLEDPRQRFAALRESFSKLEATLNMQSSKTDGQPTADSAGLSLDELLQPTDEMQQYRNAAIANSEGRYDEAQGILEALVAERLDNARYQNSLGVMLHKMGKYREALEAFQKAVELEPDNALYQNSLGVTLHKMGKYREALEAFQKAVELEPDNARYQDSLGVTLHEMGKYNEALEAKRKAVELEPDNARYQNNLGTTLYKMGKYREALEASQKAVELEPDNAHCQCGFGIALASLERYDEALKAVLQARKLAPDDGYPYYGLGIVLRGQKRYDEALEASQKAVELKPEAAYHHWRLAQILHDMERNNEALSAAQKAAELKPNNEHIQETLQAIQTALANQ